jgi:hypothetical protein
MKQRLKAIIDACTDQSADNAPILKMLKSMHDEWKEPVSVIECGYIAKTNAPINSDDPIEILKYTYPFKGEEESWDTEDWPPCKVTMIIEECDDE